ncbi:MAG: TonB-dependent receptor plug domain-containing protein [Thermodesulfobacteriota bacterium]
MCRRRHVLVVGLLLGLWLVPGMLNAQENQEAEHQMDEVVVSATRSETLLKDAPQNVTVLDREAIMNSPYDRVEDIVRNLPGMYNFRHNSLQTNGIISPLIMRGVGKNKVLFLVDGVPQNDNFNNSISWVAWGHIPKEAIERIEIVRGPTSALYGSQGLGGVVHIITKSPAKQKDASLSAQSGTASTFRTSGLYSQKFDKAGVLVSGGYAESDGFYMQDEKEDYDIKRHRDVGQLMGKASYDLGPDTDISLASLLYDHETGKGREYFYDELQLDQHWLNFSHQGELLDIKSLVYLNRADKTAYQDKSPDFDSLLRKEEAPSDTWGADVQGTLKMTDWTRLTLGTAFKQASWDYDNIYTQSTRDEGAEGKQRFISPFANLDLHFFDRALIINFGARYDWMKTYDGANWDDKAGYDNKFDEQREESFSPKMGIIYHADQKTTFRASGGKGFRAPSLFEMYKVHVRGGGTYFRQANPDLEAEEIWSYDLGVERYLTDNLLGKVTFYQSRAKDYIGDRLIDTEPISGDRTRYTYKLDNISEVDIYGLENELHWQVRHDLSLFGNYTYNISKVDKDEANPDLEGNYLPNQPKHKVHLGLNYQNPELVNVNLLANYSRGIYFNDENTLETGGYWTMDLALSRKVTDRMQVFVNAQNILDKEYPIFLRQGRADDIAPGRIVMAGIKVDL